MRVVVSGTHASGKSTLIADFARRHPRFDVHPDPFELVDDASDSPDVDTFFYQLRISAARLAEADPGVPMIAERGPLDFLAYLEAHDALGRPGASEQLARRGWEITRAVMPRVDVLVLLPLTGTGGIEAPDDEDPELRAAMDDALRELSEDPDLVPSSTRVVELAGARGVRLAALEEFLGVQAASSPV